MKELSIEQKAKAYDEALKRAKILYNDKNEIGYANAESVLEEIFPLLKESEDEKTKKILHSISSKISFHLHDIFTEEEFQCFDTWSNAWLENQGEPSIKWNKNTEGNKPQVNHTVLMKTIHGIAEGEWIGEGWLQYRWAGIVRDSDVLSWIEFSDLEKLGETE